MKYTGLSSQHEFNVMISAWYECLKQCWDYNLVAPAVEILSYDTAKWVFVVQAIYECESVVEVQRKLQTTF
jgi:hypothetical protein